jgi:hypothetical protein
MAAPVVMGVVPIRPLPHPEVVLRVVLLMVQVMVILSRWVPEVVLVEIALDLMHRAVVGTVEMVEQVYF